MVDLGRVQLVQGRPIQPGAHRHRDQHRGQRRHAQQLLKLRDVGAIARETLVSAAMLAIGDTNRGNYSVSNGVILHARAARSAATARWRALPGLTLPPARRWCRTPNWPASARPWARPDILFKVDGSAIYGLDVRVPGMVYAVIRHCPSFGGTLRPRRPSRRARSPSCRPRSSRGTRPRRRGGGNVNAVAVVAGNTWMPGLARRAWRWRTLWPDKSEQRSIPRPDAQALMTTATPYVPGGTNGPGTLYTVERSTADPNAAIDKSAKVVEATYTLPYVSHACMEVLNCTVDYVAGTKCEGGRPRSRPRARWHAGRADRAHRGQDHRARDLPRRRPRTQGRNRFHQPGGPGGDGAGQAGQADVAARREDFTHDQYRPMALVRARAGMDAGGAIAGWTYRNVSPSILAQRGSVLGATGDSQGEASQALPTTSARLTEYVTHPRRCRSASGARWARRSTPSPSSR